MAKNMLVGEMARRCGLSASALRFYDECGLLTPVSVEAATGYRYYDDGQVPTAVLIRDLRAIGLGVRSVRDFLAAPLEHQLALLAEQEARLHVQTTQAGSLIRALRLQVNHKENHMSTMTVDREQFLSAVRNLLPVTGTDPEYPLLQSMLIEAQQGSLRLVATDRYRLAVHDLPPTDGGSATFRAMIPAASARRAATALGSGGQSVTLSVDERQLSIALDGIEVTVPRIAADYVDYQALLAADPAAHVLVTSLPETLAVVDTYANQPMLRLEFLAGEMSFAAGEATVPASYDGPGIVLHVNPAFLRDAVHAAAGPDLALEASAPDRPLVIRSADRASHVHLLMPIRPAQEQGEPRG